MLGSRDFFSEHREQIMLTGVLGQLYRNGGRIPGAGEHGRGRTRVVLGCELQADYRTNHSESGAAVILWALYLAAVVFLGDDSLLAWLEVYRVARHKSKVHPKSDR